MMNAPNNSLVSSVVVVTVTYGNRRDMLLLMLEGCIQNGVAKIVVVDNGATWPVKSDLADKYPTQIDVVTLGKNTGSAIGFSTGIQRALEIGAQELWLLDDDMLPELGCLNILKAQHSILANRCGEAYVAVLAARSSFLEVMKTGNFSTLMNPSSSTFLEFNGKELISKILKRKYWKTVKNYQKKVPVLFEIKMATYGGLYFDRSIIERIGLPNTDFILYVDDYEFTYRITKNGGTIMLVTSAVVTELEPCWNSSEVSPSSFHAWLSGSDFRAYYTARNMTYFERHVRPGNIVMYYINMYLYLTLLQIMAIVLKKTSRMALLRDAIRNGTAMRLGVDVRFPLSQ